MDKSMFYLQNKRMAQTISKLYHIDYKDSQKIVNYVFSETLKAIVKMSNNNIETRKKSDE